MFGPDRKSYIEKPARQNFVELDSADATYLLNLINEIDLETAYTARQRGYTVPKLEQIASNPKSGRRLAFQDVEYLLDLLEDDDLEETQQERFMVTEKLQAIVALQSAQKEAMRDIEEQRAARRARRSPAQALQSHFERVSAI